MLTVFVFGVLIGLALGYTLGRVHAADLRGDLMRRRISGGGELPPRPWGPSKIDIELEVRSEGVFD
ncbi:MAG: hypothetical protein K940chlam2_01811 [Chlamydiae bacterium]|nr:hypothetical protein [Chlamydiota bacterium]